MTINTVNTSADISCLGVVLVGGLSTRMGQDKAKLMRNNVDMLSFSKQLLLDSGIRHVVISGGEQSTQNASTNLAANIATNTMTDIVTDIIKKAGPVGGIHSVLERFKPKALLILPVDLPLMTTNALQQLRLAGELSQKATFFQGHNIPLYLPNNAYLELFLTQAFTIKKTDRKNKNKNGPSIKALLNQVPNQAINAPDINTLFNSNTPEQWQQAQKHFS
ncbi:MAG: molybdenum cofactor guanylyltransferase [Colwellia sp.]